MTSSIGPTAVCREGCVQCMTMLRRCIVHQYSSPLGPITDTRELAQRFALAHNASLALPASATH